MRAFWLPVALSILVIPSQFVLADTTVVPGALAVKEGGYSNFYPFGMDSVDPLNQNPLVSQRYQQAYDASAFAGLTGPLTIEGISFRPDAVLGSAFATTLSDIQINLSTTLSFGNLTEVFANNVGSDDTIVVDRGTLSLSSGFTGPAGGPKDFDIYIALDNPFVYDPTAGNLLLDVPNYLGQEDSSILPVFDADLSGELWRGYTTNPVVDGVSSSDATYFGPGFGLATQFTFTPSETGDPATVPVPGAALLAMIGLGMVAHRQRRRRCASSTVMWRGHDPPNSRSSSTAKRKSLPLLASHKPCGARPHRGLGFCSQGRPGLSVPILSRLHQFVMRQFLVPTVQ